MLSHVNLLLKRFVWKIECLVNRCNYSLSDSHRNVNKYTNECKPQGPEEMCLSLEHQNPSKTSEKMGYFYCVTVPLHIL